jgi:4-hydroxybenzoate polyprenyltransferase
VRVPNLFTAPPDVLLGAALVATVGGVELSPATLGGLAVASMLLYAGGTTLNDAFDAPEDERERPERPIPSGRVDRTTAFGLGGGLLAAAIAVAFLAGGTRSAGAAGAVTGGILLYDGALKGGPLGFLAMGSVRGMNVLLGATAAVVPLATLPSSAVAVPVFVTAYIAAVTYMAAQETEVGNRTPVGVAAVGALAAVAGLGWHLIAVGPALLEAGLALALGAGFLWWVGRPLGAAYADPVPERVGPAVGACVLGLVILDAAFAAVTGVGWALAAVAFLLPARALSSAFDVS